MPLQEGDQAAFVLRASPGKRLAVVTSAGYLLCFRDTEQLSAAPHAHLVRADNVEWVVHVMHNMHQMEHIGTKCVSSLLS